MRLRTRVDGYELVGGRTISRCRSGSFSDELRLSKRHTRTISDGIRVRDAIRFRQSMLEVRTDRRDESGGSVSEVVLDTFGNTIAEFTRAGESNYGHVYTQIVYSRRQIYNNRTKYHDNYDEWFEHVADALAESEIAAAAKPAAKKEKLRLIADEYDTVFGSPIVVPSSCYRPAGHDRSYEYVGEYRYVNAEPLPVCELNAVEPPPDPDVLEEQYSTLTTEAMQAMYNRLVEPRI